MLTYLLTRLPFRTAATDRGLSLGFMPLAFGPGSLFFGLWPLVSGLLVLRSFKEGELTLDPGPPFQETDPLG